MQTQAGPVRFQQLPADRPEGSRERGGESAQAAQPHGTQRLGSNRPFYTQLHEKHKHAHSHTSYSRMGLGELQTESVVRML